MRQIHRSWRAARAGAAALRGGAHVRIRKQSGRARAWEAPQVAQCDVLASASTQ